MSTGDNGSVWQTDLPGLPAPRRGKVRDIYDLGDRILLVATDRLSAYDHILRPAIPGKGKILTQLTNFWMERLSGHRPEPPAGDRGRATSPPSSQPLRRRARRTRGRSCARPRCCRSSAWRAASSPAAPSRSTATQAPPAASRCRPASSGRAASPSRSSRRRPRRSRATTRTSTSRPSRPASGAATASRLRDLTLALYRAGAAARRVGRPPARRHQVRVRHDRRRDRADRRGPDPGLLALLGGGAWRPGRRTGLVRQAVRPQLARRLGLGPRIDAARARRRRSSPGTRDRYVEAFRRLTGREPRL